MKIRWNKLCARSLGALVVLLLTGLPLAQFKDWKGQLLETQLKRKHPPEYFIIRTAVELRVRAQVPAAREFAGLLHARLESGLFAQDSRLQPATGKPETLIICDITRLDANDTHWEQRQVQEYEKTGQHSVYNDKKKKYETKDDYGYVTKTKRYQIVKGGLNISYQTRDAYSNATLDAHNILGNYSHEFLEGAGAPSDHEVREALLNQAVAQLVKRLTPTVEEIKVSLPRGKVEDFSKLGQAGLWGKMLECIEKLDTLKDQKDEAYRQFGLGIANEALAYQEPKVEDAAKQLQEAVIHYNKALELKADEKYFREPLARIQQSLEQYKKLSEQLAAAAQAKTIANAKSPAPPVVTGAKGFTPSGTTAQPTHGPIKDSPRAPVLTNQKVIEMVAAGLDETTIITAINKEMAVQFNLGPDGLIELARNKVAPRIITAMRARQSRSADSQRRSNGTIRRRN